jgi:hypothetical protein
MTIHFERTGGVAGLRIAVSLATESLSAAQAEKLERLVREANLAAPPQTPPLSGGPDRFHYSLTVEMNGARQTVELDEANVPPRMRPLLSALERFARHSQ